MFYIYSTGHHFAYNNLVGRTYVLHYFECSMSDPMGTVEVNEHEKYTIAIAMINYEQHICIDIGIDTCTHWLQYIHWLSLQVIVRHSDHGSCWNTILVLFLWSGRRFITHRVKRVIAYTGLTGRLPTVLLLRSRSNTLIDYLINYKLFTWAVSGLITKTCLCLTTYRA